MIADQRDEQEARQVGSDQLVQALGDRGAALEQVERGALRE
ncbi:MAG TPA: hypothetical protein VF002_10605 [Gaiellaceae bacterium]